MRSNCVLTCKLVLCPALRRVIEDIDPRSGSVMRAVWFTGESRPMLLLSAHHLTVDVVSWHILLTDVTEVDPPALGPDGRTP